MTSGGQRWVFAHARLGAYLATVIMMTYTRQWISGIGEIKSFPWPHPIRIGFLFGTMKINLQLPSLLSDSISTNLPHRSRPSSWNMVRSLAVCLNYPAIRTQKPAHDILKHQNSRNLCYNRNNSSTKMPVCPRLHIHRKHAHSFHQNESVQYICNADHFISI